MLGEKSSPSLRTPNASKSVKLVDKNLTLGDDIPIDFADFIQPILSYLNTLVSSESRTQFRDRLLHLISVSQQVAKSNPANSHN